jgi:hypothetical protein
MVSVDGAKTDSVRLCARCTDLWSWLVQYHDETILPECQGTSMPHNAWAKVEKTKVKNIVLVPRKPGLEQVVVDVGAHSPVFFRRRYKELNISGGQEVSQQNIHCLGYEAADGTGNYVFVFEDGSVLLSTNRNAV